MLWILNLPAWGQTVVTLPADGEQQTVVPVQSFGRTSFEVRSAYGASLQLVDRMSGPGPQDGVIGQTDGRLDAFVDVGELKVLTRGPRGADGDLQVLVTPSERRGDSPQLRRRERVHTELADHTERAWWIDHEGGTLHLEAIGRHVDDLRLWRDGTWLEDARPTCRTLEPVSGRPIRQCTLSASPEPGLLQLVAYGGPGSPWAEDTEDTFLQVRWDLEELPANGQRVGRLDSTGRFVAMLPAATRIAHLALDEHQPAALHLDGGSSSPFRLSSPSATITDEQRTPSATVISSSSGTKRVAIEGVPGARFTLSWFEDRKRWRLPGGASLLTTLSTAHPADAFPPTMVITRRTASGRDELVDHHAVEVGTGEVFRTRFNLLKPLRFLLHVDEESTHRVELEEGSARIRVVPFWTDAPPDHRPPDPRAGLWQDSLLPGLYVVEVLPDKPGVVGLTVTRNDWTDLARSAFSDLRPVTLLPEIRKTVDLQGALPHTAWIFQPGDVRRGLVSHALPLDLSRHHALPIGPGETATFPVHVPTAMALEARRPNGEPLQLGIPGQLGHAVDVPAGTWPLTLVHEGDSATLLDLGAPYAPDPPTPLPQGRLQALPDFPRLADTPVFGDLERDATRTYRLSVPADGLYHLQSTGLLATRGSLRSRVKTALGTGQANGVGRNFRIASYLRSGDYQVTLGTFGRSAGHYGLELAAVGMRDGGVLRLDETARETLPAESGVVYRFEVDRRRELAIRSGNPSGDVPCRLEDTDGWPVVRPMTRCNTTLTLDEGTYVLRSMPVSVAAKRSTSITTQPLATAHTGHGPFALGLGVSEDKLWTEPPGEGERPSDRWTFTLPAETGVRIPMGADMAGRLEQNGDVLERLVPGRTWTGDLPAGDYTLAVQASRRSTGIPYQVAVHTDVLTVGQHRDVRLPTTLDVRIGQAGLVTLQSDGEADARARLLKPDGTLVATNDDRPDGWDFQIATWLEPGDYRLQVDHVGRQRRTRLHVAAPDEQEGNELSVGKPLQVDIGATPTVHPLRLRDARSLVHIAAEAGQNIGLSLQMESAEGWVDLGQSAGRSPSLFARRVQGRPLRLRLWSVDGRSSTATVELETPSRRAPSLAAFADGVFDDEPILASAKNLRSGLYRVQGDRSALRWCPLPGVPCTTPPAVVGLERAHVLIGRSLQLEPVSLDQPVPIELSAGPLTVQTPAAGPVVAIARTGDTPIGLTLERGASTVGDGASLALGEGDVQLRGRGGARLQVVPLATERLSAVPRAVTVPPRTSVRIPLDRVDRRHPITLERGLVARIGDAVAWADAESLQVTLPGRGELELANPTESPLLARLPTAKDTAEPLGPDNSEEWYATRTGAAVHRLEGEGTVFAHNGTLALLRDQDVPLVGNALPYTDGDTVLLQHGTGWTALWTEDDEPGPVGAITRELKVDEPGVHRIEADGPFAAHLDIDGRRSVVLRPEGGAVDVVVTGRGRVGLRPLGDQPDIRVHTTLLDVPTLGEGQGPEILLEAGRAAWFRFDLDEARPIGVGVRASADRVRTRILGPDGRVRAQGVVAMADLEAGRWYVALDQDASEAPVRARPAIAGLEPPDDGPPDDVLRTYIDIPGGDR